MPVVADEVRRAADEDDVVAADEDLLEEARHGPRAVRVPHGRHRRLRGVDEESDAVATSVSPAVLLAFLELR